MRTFLLWMALLIVMNSPALAGPKVVYSPDGKHLAAARWNHKVQVLDSSTLAVIKHLPIVAGNDTDLAYSPDGRYLAVGLKDGQMLVYDLEADAVEITASNIGKVLDVSHIKWFVKEEKVYLVAAGGKMEVRIYDWEERKVIMHAESGWLAFGPEVLDFKLEDGKVVELLADGSHYSVRYFPQEENDDLAAKRLDGKILDYNQSKNVYLYKAEANRRLEKWWYKKLTPDADGILCFGLASHKVQIWPHEGPMQFECDYGANVEWAVISPNGKQLAVIGALGVKTFPITNGE